MKHLLPLLLLWTLTTAARADYPTTPQDVAFTARDGTEQRYVVLLPDRFDPAQSHDALVALHGHGSDRWQFVRQARDECRAVRDVGSERGLILVSPDYRASTSWMGPQAEVDMLAIIAAIRRDYRVRRVFLCGGSMGASASLTFAALHPDLVAGVAAMNGTANHLEYENFQEAIRASFGGTKAQIPEEYKRRSAEYWPERLTMPVAVTTGGRDESVPPASVLRLADVLGKLQRKVLVIHRDEMGHATSYEDGRAALDYVLREAAPD
jgi:pimeloyl-ACP methyl ester carboxylesterase